MLHLDTITKLKVSQNSWTGQSTEFLTQRNSWVLEKSMTLYRKTNIITEEFNISDGTVTTHKLS